MSVQSAVPGLVGHWRTTTAGYNTTATRLTDFSGFGNHLVKLAGTPDFTIVKSSQTGFKMHGDCYFGSDSTGSNQFQLPSTFTWVAVLHPNLNAAEAFYPVYATQRTYASLDDPEWAAPTDAFADNAATALIFRLLSTNAVFGDLTYGVTGNATFTVNQWRVFTLVLDAAQDGLRKIRVDGGAYVSDTAPTQQRHLLFNDDFRLGHFATGTITTAGGESMTSLQHMLYTGDVTTTSNTEYGALITALLANPAV